jgi:hypothetical protein
MATFEELLVSTRLLSPVQIAVAHRDAELSHRRLASTILDLGLVDEVLFAQWMSQHSGSPLMHPVVDDAVQALERRVPRGIAREFEIVPVEMRADELTVATVNPLDTIALDILRTATRLRVRAVVARQSEVTRLLQKFYPEDDMEQTILPAGFGQSGDDSPGMSTQMITPRTPETQLDRIERHLAALTAQIDRIEKRIDAIDAALGRVVPGG